MLCKYCHIETNTTRSHKRCVDKASNARKIAARKKKLGIVYKDLVCPNCGKTFTQTSTIQKYCDPNCREVIHLAQNRARAAQYYKDRKPGQSHARRKGEGVAELYITPRTEAREQKLADEIVLRAWQKANANERAIIQTNPLNRHMLFVEG